MPRPVALLPFLVAAACSSDPGPQTLGREVLDCTSGDELCEVIEDTGCSVAMGAAAPDGGTGGGCADAGPRRICTSHCESDPECPEGWTCLEAAACPQTTVSYCVPSAAELAAQALAGCSAVADPGVCGFY